jgi:RNA polymerase sigma-70 factor, ECF subfamily
MRRPIAQGADEELAASLRRGDVDAFATLVDRHSPAMIRVAMVYVPTRAAAEEAVQETWILLP